MTFLDKNIILFNRFYGLMASRLLKVPEMIGHKSHDIWKIISRKIDHFFERVKGRRPTDKKGSLSLYWQSFDDSKNNNE